MLAIGSWLCAPLVGFFGASSITLKLPMLGFNFAIVGLLWTRLRREPGVGNAGAFVATLPFALPGVVTASRLVEHQGGNVEPFLFVLLGFLARRRPVILGLVFGVGFLNREFALIGFIALILLDAAQGRFRARRKAHAITLGTIVMVSVVVRAIATLGPDYRGDPASPSLVGLTNLNGISGFFTLQLPTLLGGFTRALRDYNISSALSVGHSWVWYLFLLWFVAVAAIRLPRIERAELDSLSSYLVLVGFGQAAAYIIMCTAPHDVMLVRYALLSYIAVVGLIATAWKEPRLRWVTALLVTGLVVANGSDHAHLAAEYLERRPQHENELLAAELTRRGVRYGVADYWVSYDVSWLTDEKIILSPPRGQADRMRRYNDAVSQHWDEAVEIAGAPCPGGTPVLRWYLCRPQGARRPGQH
jgi:hypothetical protein